MKKFVSKSKLSKKARKEKEVIQRNTWGDVNPATRVIPNKKKYNRKKDKKVMNQEWTSE